MALLSIENWIKATSLVFSGLSSQSVYSLTGFFRRNGSFLCVGKVWRRPFGRFLKRFLLNVKPGEEDHTLMQYQSALMATRCDVTQRQISCDNNGSEEICELERKITSLR